MSNFPKTPSEAFEKLDKETKEAFSKVLKENNGLPTFFKALTEFMKVDNPDAERNVYLASVLAFLMINVKTEQEKDETLHHYEVAQRCGGIMENPEIWYENHQIVEASCEEEARMIYNERNRCSYYYGEVLRRID